MLGNGFCNGFNGHNSQFPIPNSQFPIPNSQFPIPNSQFPIPNSQFPIPNNYGRNLANFTIRKSRIAPSVAICREYSGRSHSTVNRQPDLYSTTGERGGDCRPSSRYERSAVRRRIPSKLAVSPSTHNGAHSND